MQESSLGARRRAVVVIAMICALAGISLRSAAAQTPETPPPAKPAVPPSPIEAWLMAGPVDFPMPAFAEEKRKRLELKALLDVTPLDFKKLWPEAGKSLTLPASAPLVWAELAAPGGTLTFTPTPAPAGGNGTPEIVLLATYLESDLFAKRTLVVKSGHLVRAFLDGEEVLKKEIAAPRAAANDPKPVEEKPADEKPAAQDASGKLKLTPGKHLLVLQAIYDPQGAAEWKVEVELKTEPDDAGVAVRVGTSTRHRMRVGDLLDSAFIAGVATSPDGEAVAIRLRQPDAPGDQAVEWIELRATSTGQLLMTLRGEGGLSGFAWAPEESAARYGYVTRKEGRATLWVGDFAAGGMKPVLEAVEHFGAFEWCPDGKSIIYSVTDPEPPNTKGVKRLDGLQDQWSSWRDESYLYQLVVADGTRRRLTAGAISTTLQDVSPDSSRLLFTRTIFDAVRPYEHDELYELEFATLVARKIATLSALKAVSYDPSGERALVLAGPSEFGGKGLNLASAEQIPNDYESEAYVLELATGAAESWSREFAPSIDDAVWSQVDGNIYLRATDGDRVRLYRYDVDRREYTVIPSGVEVVDGMSLARHALELVFYGSSPFLNPRVLAQDLEALEQPRLITAPEADRYRHIIPGTHKDWAVDLKDGLRMTASIYFPPGFDAARKYPLIVFYYGGTFPTTRVFGGRYPRELWVAHGYVVLTLEPRGAIGFGQDFAAQHVNNWGRTVAGEIIESTEKFLATHDYVDAKRVGCIGASYGGFMTMLLTTKTDLFAGAISHAGISSLASYWGEGWWGFQYSAIASANSFPWNARDLYIEQSALFHADKIRTPLLLLHGTGDTNVPKGESDQLYAALKLLERPVEYVQFLGDNHWILDYPKRVLFIQTIIAWFDRHLKGDDGYWRHLHPEAGEEEQ
ncbi:MAG: S9 family peptidase [Planctomycetota bacterium]